MFMRVSVCVGAIMLITYMRVCYVYAHASFMCTYTLAGVGVTVRVCVCVWRNG